MFFLFFFQCVNDDEIDDNIPIIKKNFVPEVSKVNHLSALKIAFDSGKKILGQYGNRSGRGSIDTGICEVRSLRHYWLPPSGSLSDSMTSSFSCLYTCLLKSISLDACLLKSVLLFLCYLMVCLSIWFRAWI